MNKFYYSASFLTVTPTMQIKAMKKLQPEKKKELQEYEKSIDIARSIGNINDSKNRNKVEQNSAVRQNNQLDFVLLNFQ